MAQALPPGNFPSSVNDKSSNRIVNGNSSVSFDTPVSCLETVNSKNIPDFYTELIQLNNKNLLPNLHNFQECNICCSCKQSPSYQNTDRLYDYIYSVNLNQVTNKKDNSEYASESQGSEVPLEFNRCQESCSYINRSNLDSDDMNENNNRSSTGTETSEIPLELNQCKETYNCSNLDLNSFTTSVCHFNKADLVLEIAQLKADKFCDKVSELLADVEKKLGEKHISPNKIKIILEENLNKLLETEHIILTETLPCINMLLQKIINNINEENVIDLPSQLYGMLEMFNTRKTIEFGHSLSQEGSLFHKQEKSTFEQMEKLEQVANDGGICDSSIDSSESYESDTSTSSMESNIESIVDCENKIVTIPFKTTLFLSHLKLKNTNIKKLYQLAYRLNLGIIAEEVQNITTHLVVPDSWKEKNLSVSYSYLAAIAQQAYIVTYRWIVDCLKAGRALPASSYTPNQQGALSCLQKQRKKLLEGFCIYFPETEESETKKKNQILAEYCGATISSDMQCTEGKKVIVTDGLTNVELMSQYLDSKWLPVHSKWLHDSIFFYEIQPMKNYTIKNINAIFVHF